MEGKEASWVPRTAPEMAPVSSTGKNPLGILTMSRTLQAMVRNSTSRVGSGCASTQCRLPRYQASTWSKAFSLAA